VKRWNGGPGSKGAYTLAMHTHAATGSHLSTTLLCVAVAVQAASGSLPVRFTPPPSHQTTLPLPSLLPPPPPPLRSLPPSLLLTWQRGSIAPLVHHFTPSTTYSEAPRLLLPPPAALPLLLPLLLLLLAAPPPTPRPSSKPPGLLVGLVGLLLGGLLLVEVVRAGRMAEVILVASLLATAFSVMAKQERMAPRSSGSSHVTCCCRVPYLVGEQGGGVREGAGGR
jgi:hypothetical protein